MFKCSMHSIIDHEPSRGLRASSCASTESTRAEARAQTAVNWVSNSSRFVARLVVMAMQGASDAPSYRKIDVAAKHYTHSIAARRRGGSMPTYIVLLRAVNVGGYGKLAMADFRKLLEELGFKNVETYIQSGNAVFDAKGSAATVAKLIAAALEKHTGAPVGLLIRTHEQLGEIIDGNPFATEANADGARVHAGFLFAAPPKNATEGLIASSLSTPTAAIAIISAERRSICISRTVLPIPSSRAKLSSGLWAERWGRLATGTLL